jgi:hypothetical protein
MLSKKITLSVLLATGLTYAAALYSIPRIMGN